MYDARVVKGQTARRDFLSWSAAGLGLGLAGLACAAGGRSGPSSNQAKSPPSPHHVCDGDKSCTHGVSASASSEFAQESGVSGAGTSEASAADFLELRGLCDGVKPIESGAFEERRELTRRSLRDSGFAALVTEAGINLTYLTGVRWGQSERALLYILPVRGDPVWVAPAFERGTLGDKLLAAATVEGWEEDVDPFQLTAKLTAKLLKGQPGRVALDPAMRSFVGEGLRSRIGSSANVEGEWFDGLRALKSPEELAILRRANEATVTALTAVGRRLAPEMSESDARPLVHAALAAAGLSDTWALVLFGPNAAYPHGSTQQHRLRSGDMALIDAGGALHGYQSDITRTFAVGTPEAKLARAYETVRRAQVTALAAMRSGQPCAKADAAARAEIAASGYGGGYSAMSHRLGHGIGMVGHEPPYLRPGNSALLRPGMTMSNEPGIYVPGEFGIRLEDIVAITQGEPELFGALAPPL